MALPRTIARRLSANVLFLVLDSGVVNAISFGLSLLVARWYDPDVLGRLGTLLAVLAVGVLLGDLGSGQASTLLISRHVAGMEPRRPGPIAAAGLLQNAVGGAIVAALLLVLPDAAVALLERAGMAERAAQVVELSSLVRLIAVWVLAATMMQQTAGIFAGLQRTQHTLLQSTLTHVPRLAVTVAVALAARPWEWIAWGWTASYTLAGVAAVGLALRVLRRGGHRLGLKGYRPAWRLRVGAALWTPLAAGFILQYLAVGILWWMTPGEAYASVGLFVPLWSLTRAYEVLLMPLGVALLPAVSDAHGARDARVVGSLVRRGLLLTGLAATAVLALFMAVPERLLGFFGEAYTGQATALMVLAFGVAFEAQRCALDPLLNGSGLARWVTVLDWAKFALLLGLGVPLYAAMGFEGLAWAFVGTFVPAWAAKLVLLRAKLGVHVLLPAVVLAALLAAEFGAGLAWRAGG